VAEYRPSEAKKPSFPCGVLDVRAIQGVRVSEHRGGLREYDAMFGQIRSSLLRIAPVLRAVLDANVFLSAAIHPGLSMSPSRV
jgi:hypothetical protein